jgi:hypothetical protein
MTFVEPYILWGALAIAVPIAIHFWHQKRGKLLPWAATQWLTEKNQQQSRGLRLDNVPLLILRCLLLLLLAVLLAQPLLSWRQKETTRQRIHLVQPNALVTANFRFELDEASRKGEKIYWANETPEPYSAASNEAVQPGDLNPLRLQTALDKLPVNDADNTELHLYIVNDPSLADVPAITVPAHFRLHTLVDSAGKPRPYLAVSNGKRLFVDRSGQLTSTATPVPGLTLQPNPAHSGPLRVLAAYKSTPERQSVRAALAALSQVYDLPLTVDEKPVDNINYDWVLTDQLPPASEQNSPSKTLYTVSGIDQTPASTNVVFTTESLTPQTSERVAGGQLPEWLGEQLIQHFGLLTSQEPLDQQALNARFVPGTKHMATHQATVQNALILLILILLIVERGLALTKNA